MYSSEITVTALTVSDRASDVTYCADKTLFLHATSGGLSLTTVFFCLAFYCFKCCLGSFCTSCKTVSPSNILLKHAEEDQIDIRSKFISLMNTATRENTAFGVHSVK